MPLNALLASAAAAGLTASFSPSDLAQFPGGSQTPPPQIQIRWNATGYGQFGCIQRVMNRLYAIGATSVNQTTNGVWGNLGSTSTLVWCRGSEAITIAAGPNATAVVDQVREAF